MDEATIISAIQEDLQNYKVKTQIRRKQSQLHVLITREEGDDLDYAFLYDMVKRRIDKLPIEGADCLVVYGRLAGAKHPEWQKTSEIKPPLPLIELDLDELQDFNDIGVIENLSFSVDNDETITQSENLEADFLTDNDLQSFKSSIEDDLKIAQSTHEINNSKIDDLTTEDFDLEDLDLEAFKLDDLQQNTSDLDSFEAELFEVDSQELSQRSPIQQNNAQTDEDFTLDSPTLLAIPMPLPPPRRTRKNPASVVEPEVEILPNDSSKNKNKSLLFSVAFAFVAIAVLGICGWLVWDRSNQQQYLVNARSFGNEDINLKKITKLETLTETRNRLQAIVSQLEEIPDRPASLYADAQSELTTLRPKLADFDRKINVEQEANKNLESAKNITLEAAKLSQNPPHKSTVWKSAQEKRQQAIKMLEEIPSESLLYANSQDRLKAYRSELVQISRRLEFQQRAELSVSSINPVVVNQLKQLKSKTPEKPKFLAQCQTILRSQITNAEVQRSGLPIAPLTAYLCAYFWDS
jgi:hypothetical protein